MSPFRDSENMQIMAGDQPEDPVPEVTVIVVSYNTRELTLAAVRTLLDNNPGLAMHVVVWDNASVDGSAAAVAAAFPSIEVIASPENIGFAAANNRVAAAATTPFICLLNPDTETHFNAISNLLAFAKAHPEAGIVGGRTVFRDGSLNPASCWRKMTPWTLFTSTFGLARLFPNSNLLNAEAMGGWRRDSVRHVDIVVGCLMLVPTELWQRLGGFDERFFMYGEDADFCLRARALGYRPMITPDATIMHLVGASTKRHADKVCSVMQAKSTLIRRHWPKRLVWVGLFQLWLWGLARGMLAKVHTDPGQRDRLGQIWRERDRWLAGFPEARV
jgi:N-acetylglucosaminyl-diphospho-decaprenol L-rhamnosyltransferase